MKRCPECRRDYYDDTLLYCLDDGNALLEGPATASSGDEPATAILSVTPAIEGGLTGTTDETDVKTAILQPPANTGGSDSPAKSRGFDRRLLFAPIALAIIVLGGFFGYRYVTQAKQIESIAVMPFVNESGNADVEYLSDGMTETLISSLSQLANLNVKGRSSVFRYKGKDVDTKTLGKELGVQAVLYGRVLQRGDQLTLSLELLDAVTENVIWSGKYDRKQSDVLTLQTEIARDVSRRLKSRLSGEETAKVEKNYTANLEAYQLYLKGLFQYNRLTGDGLKQAAEFYKLAIEKDQNYAEAHAALAMAYLNFSNYSVAPPKDSMPLAKAAALRALELDETLGSAHVALARYRSEFEWDRAGAETAIRRAIELDPNNPRPHGLLALILAQQKRFDESVGEANRAQQLEPLSLPRNLNYAERLVDAHRFDEALALLRSLLQQDPNFANIHWDLGLTYLAKGMHQESVASFQRAFELDPDPMTKGYMAVSYGKLGQRNEALKQLEWLKQESPRRYVPSFAFALAYLGLDQKDEAFVWLEKDLDERTIYASSYAIEPALNDIRSDPRFKEFLKRMNLPE